MKYEISEFYCINCGNRGIDLMRRQSKQHKAGHMKKLYCLNCQIFCNHYECHNLEDVNKFKNKFEKGEFIELAKESIEECKKDRWMYERTSTNDGNSGRR